MKIEMFPCSPIQFQVRLIFQSTIAFIKFLHEFDLEQESYFSTVTNGDLISIDATITLGFDLLAPLFEAKISGDFELIDDYEVIFSKYLKYIMIIFRKQTNQESTN